MKNKILKLCKRMSKVTAFEIAPILMITEAEAGTYLNELVAEDKLTVREDLIYFYKEEIHRTPTHPLFFEFHSDEETLFILKCFCVGIKTEQSGFLLGMDASTVQKFNLYFRTKIYENQLAKLKEHFYKKPKLPKMRTFYDIPVYFYMYNNKLFVVDKPLTTSTDKVHTKSETLKFKVLYSRLTRCINHSRMKIYMHCHIAEHILRMDYNCDELLEFMQKLLL